MLESLLAWSDDEKIDADTEITRMIFFMLIILVD
jgi:hypothetical protein